MKKFEARAFLGRFLLALIFVASGLGKLAAWNPTISYMSANGVPWPGFFLTLAVLIEVFGGLALMAGYKTKTAAGLIFLYLIPVTLVFHSFWRFEGMERQLQMVNFLKNLSIMGGLLIVNALGAGRAALDRLTTEARREGAEIRSLDERRRPAG